MGVRSLVVIVLTLASVSAGASEVRTHALLVGVSEYPYLGADVQLIGPRNDVELWRSFLQERGIARDNTRVLADGIDGATGLPTRAAILGALESMAEEAASGDFVFMLFAGHGAQQPASAATIGDEPDGLDEIFLPRDARGWNAPRASVENSIIDAEFKVAIDAIRAKGAFVWAVFDTCHSATMTRAVTPGGVRYRQATPAQLGIPREALEEARALAAQGEARTRGQGGAPARQAPLGRISEDLEGGLVAFYAAQSTQETPEFPLPRGSAEARDHGVFSFTLYQVLNDAPAASYSQVMDSVIQRFHTIPGATAVPMAEGTHLDAGVFGGEGSTVRQWRVTNDARRLRMAAGQLQGLPLGTIVSLHADPTAADDDLIAYAELTSSELVASVVRPVEHAGKEVVALRQIPPMTFARPVQVPVDFTLTIGLMDGSDRSSACEAPSLDAGQAVEWLQTTGLPIRQRLVWVDPGSGPADIWLCELDGFLYIVDDHTPMDADSGRPQAPGFEYTQFRPGTLGAHMGEALERIVRVRNLLRISQQTGAGTGVSSLSTQFFIRRMEEGAAACDELATPQPRDGSVPQPAGVEATLRDGDCVSLVVSNSSATPVDVTILYVGANYGIDALWPTARQLGNSRIEAGGRIVIGEFEAYADSMAREHLIVLGVPVEAASQPVNLSFLAQSEIPARTRGNAQQGSIQELLMDAGYGGGRTRGMGAGGRGGARLDAVVFPTRVLPQSE